MRPAKSRPFLPAFELARGRAPRYTRPIRSRMTRSLTSQHPQHDAKRVGIVTFYLKDNYGGALQAFATCEICRSLGLEPLLVRSPFEGYYGMDPDKGMPLSLLIGLYMRHRLLRPGRAASLLLRLKKALIKLRAPQGQALLHKNDGIAAHLFKRFANRHLPPVISTEDRQAIASCSCFIVGSDQVWRRRYLRNEYHVLHYLLDFADDEQRAASIAYAASFGCEHWEGSELMRQPAAELLRQFKAVSVRENSGIAAAREAWGVDAVRMPDPTLVVDAKAYDRLIESEKTVLPPKPYLATYILDASESSRRVARAAAEGLKLYGQPLMPTAQTGHRDDLIFKSVPQWLRYMRDCEAVVTDSFHGCVFSLIFNKPFLCLGNAARGSARFDTLFDTFGLRDRLLVDGDASQALDLLRQPMDWERINALLHSEQQRGLNFLRDHLRPSPSA